MMLDLRDATVERTLDDSPGSPARWHPRAFADRAVESLGEDEAAGIFLQRHLRPYRRPASAERRRRSGARRHGAVHMAKESATRRTVAMKVMLPARGGAQSLPLHRRSAGDGPARAPNIVPIYDLGVDAQGASFLHDELVGDHPRACGTARGVHWMERRPYRSARPSPHQLFALACSSTRAADPLDQLYIV